MALQMELINLFNTTCSTVNIPAAILGKPTTSVWSACGQIAIILSWRPQPVSVWFILTHDVHIMLMHVHLITCFKHLENFMGACVQIQKHFSEVEKYMFHEY